MRFTNGWIGMLGTLLLGTASFLGAADADDLRERATALKKEASALLEQGKKEEAERLFKELRGLMEKAEQDQARVKGGGEKEREGKERDGKERAVKEGEGKERGEKEREGKERPELVQEKGNPKERLQGLMMKERKLQELKGAEEELKEVREQIAAIHREFKQGSSNVEKKGDHHPDLKGLPPELQEQAKNLHNAMRRIQHVRVAAENLKAAEINDVAGSLLERAEGMEREVGQAKERLMAEMNRMRETREKKKPDAEKPDTAKSDSSEQELRREVERLRAEIKQLRGADK